MAVKWLRELDKEYPTLAATARRLNAEDGFVMAERHEKKRRHSSGVDRDGDDGRAKEGHEKRDKKKHSKRKGVGSEEGRIGEESESGRSAGSTSYKKRGRRQRHSSDRSTVTSSKMGWEDQGGSSASVSVSASSPPTRSDSSS